MEMVGGESAAPGSVYEFRWHESAREGTLFLRTPARLDTRWAVPSARMAFIRYLTCCVTASPPVAGARQARGVRRGKGGCE